MIYLDNNATTRPDERVVEAVTQALTEWWHNPSSMHRAGQSARQQIELARQSVARLIGAMTRDLIFTSGATESIDLAIRGVLATSTKRDADGMRTIITTPIEHESVRDLCKALEADPAMKVKVRLLPVGRDGVVDASVLESMLDESTAIVSMQWANNETGAIQPVEQVGALCRSRGVVMHCDGTQWVGKMPTNVARTPIDLLSFSAHKLHGPKGVGALWVRQGVRLRPVLRGTQEHERRGGTENVPGIIGFGVAAELAAEWIERGEERARLALLRDRFEQRVLEKVSGSAVNGPANDGQLSSQALHATTGRLWNTTNIAFPRLEAEALLLLLSERGLCASAGAACSSGSLDPSPVLLAMGVPEELAHGSLRFSLSRETTDAEVDDAVNVVAECVAKLRGTTAAVVR